jgi:hypothetical protein
MLHLRFTVLHDCGADVREIWSLAKIDKGARFELRVPAERSSQRCFPSSKQLPARQLVKVA